MYFVSLSFYQSISNKLILLLSDVLGHRKMRTIVDRKTDHGQKDRPSLAGRCRDSSAATKTIQRSVWTKDGGSSAREGYDNGSIRVDGSGHYGTLSVQVKRESIAQDICGGFYLL